MMTAAQQATPATSGRPNILYVHIDNLGMGELGCYGGESCAARTRRGWTASPARGCSC
jgi:arylsulfatase A-like enzyme